MGKGAGGVSGDSGEALTRMPGASASSSAMTDPVRLKLLEPDDWAFYRGLHQDPETMRFIGSPFTLARCEAMFERTLTENVSAGGRYRIWVVRVGGGRVGIASIMGVEVGVMISRQSRQRGVARNVMAGLSTRVFREGHDVAVGRTHVENRASHRLMAGLGFSRVGTRTPNIVSWMLRADAGRARVEGSRFICETPRWHV